MRGLRQFAPLRKPWIWILLVAAAAAAVYTVNSRVMEGRLVRHDPDTVPDDARLYAMGRSDGRAVFLSHCSDCHGDDGRGDRASSSPNLTDRDWLYGSGAVGEIEWTIRHGIRAHDPRTWKLASMPAFGTARPYAAYKMDSLSPGEIRDVVEFLVSLRGQKADTAAAGRGGAIFQNKGQCFDCHATDARGDTSIGAPNLTDRITLYGDGGRASLFASIAQGRAGMCPAWERRLTSLELRQAALYVYSLSHPIDQ